MDMAESAAALSQELWLGGSVWPTEMPVDYTVSVVLSWCHQGAWDALLNQR